MGAVHLFSHLTLLGHVMLSLLEILSLPGVPGATSSGDGNRMEVTGI